MTAVVHAKCSSGVQPRGDAMGVRSTDYRFTRVFTGIRRLRRTSLGTEFAGRIEEIGATVTGFRVGGTPRGAVDVYA